MLAAPLALSAFTHIWNPVGFPILSFDEGTYMERAMLVLDGLGPQESIRKMGAIVLYDHPYLGQLFLASIFQIIGFPSSFLSPINMDTHDDVANMFSTIETLYSIPRICIGILAVFDTFLVYQITQCYYNNRRISLISATFFAVAPSTYMLREILLESILLPLLLLSILFAVRLKKNGGPTNSNKERGLAPVRNNEANILLILLSGMFLGLSIFTKIPSFTMIPLVAFLVFTNTNRNLKNLGLWFIPVVLIPAIWPAYAILVGEINLWLEGVSYQATERIELPLFNKIIAFFTLDPVLLVMGVLGIVYSAMKKDFLLLLWVLPFLLFLYLVGFSLFYHLIPILPAFCIASAKMVSEIWKQIVRFRSKKKIQQIRVATFALVSALLVWEFVYTTTLITLDFNSWRFDKFAFAADSLINNRKGIGIYNYTNSDVNYNQNVTEAVSHPVYRWIFNYVFHLDSHLSVSFGLPALFLFCF